jgi:hypothetical protein
MFGLLKSVTDMVQDTATIITAPVKVAVDVVGAGIKPIAKVTEAMAKDIKDAVN